MLFVREPKRTSPYSSRSTDGFSYAELGTDVSQSTSQISSFSSDTKGSLLSSPMTDAGQRGDAGIASEPIVLPPQLDELRKCATQHWCPNKTMCGRSPQTGVLGCYGSNCKSATDFESCSSSDACVELQTGVFRCAPAGFVAKNGACYDDQFVNVAQRCASGLLCVAGKCSALCGPKNACPTGTDCQTTTCGSFCVASHSLCSADVDCALESKCMATSLGVSVCATAASLGEIPGCLPGRCAENEVCEGKLVGSQYFGRCFKHCTDHSKCLGGLTCVPNADPSQPGACHPLCQMGDELLCPWGDRCVYDFEKDTGYCTVDSPYDLSRNVSDEYRQIFTGSPDFLPSKK
jgi:hypothetical protein